MKNVIKFFFELGHLKRVPRSGWTLLGIKSPESVAEHSLRAAQIAFYIALEEKVNPYHACTRVVFHDMAETRTGDPHKLAQRYVSTFERMVVDEQCKPLSREGETIRLEWLKWTSLDDPISIVAHDADAVDVAVQAKEYMDQGYSGALEWIEYAQSKVKTETAKRILAELLDVKMTDWWQGLKKL